MSEPAASPHYRTGKICYLEIPATDISASAAFYQQIFGWQVRQRGDGSTAFDDSVGEVSGSWIVGGLRPRQASRFTSWSRTSRAR